MVLRIVAGERPSPRRLAIVRLAAGSAVWTYASMTASSTCRSRSDSGVLISAQPLSREQFRNSQVRGSSHAPAHRAAASPRGGTPPAPPSLPPTRSPTKRLVGQAVGRLGAVRAVSAAQGTSARAPVPLGSALPPLRPGSGRRRRRGGTPPTQTGSR